MDWITWTIEAIGILIFCLWLIVPIGEFRQILKRLKVRPPMADSGEKAFPPIINDEERPA